MKLVNCWEYRNVEGKKSAQRIRITDATALRLPDRGVAG